MGDHKHKMKQERLRLDEKQVGPKTFWDSFHIESCYNAVVEDKELEIAKCQDKDTDFVFNEKTCQCFNTYGFIAVCVLKLNANVLKAIQRGS